MSGFEIAGIVLALLPLVLRSVDAYRDDFRRLTVFFKPLKHVEKLSRALDLQNLLLKELIREITISSDCPDVELLDDDPQQYLKEREVCDQIKGFMGDNEYSLLVQELYSVYRSVKKVEEAISKLEHTKNFREVINGVMDGQTGLGDLKLAAKLVMNITDLKKRIQEIDSGTRILERLSKAILKNRRAAASHVSSPASNRFTKAFRLMRRLTDGLFAAIQEGFRDRCHENHGVKMYLADRFDDARKIPRHRHDKDQDNPLLTFEISFSAESQDAEDKFHEASIQVFSGWDANVTHDESQLINQTKTIVAFMVTAPPSPASNIHCIAIQNICNTIRGSRKVRLRLSLAHQGDWQLGVLSENNSENEDEQMTSSATSECHIPHSISLGHILQDPSKSCAFKLRIKLALRFASSFLLLQRTNWLAQDSSKDTIFFHHQLPSTEHNPRGSKFDLERPFIVRNFDGQTVQQTENKPQQIMAAFLELGILLLEIWHLTTLEARFEGCDPTAGNFNGRLVKALDWRDDEHSNVEGLYGQAVTFCLTGVRDMGTPAIDWDNIQFWNSICNRVLEPLSQLCRCL